MFKNPKNQKTMALVLFCNTIIYYTLHTHSQRNLSRIPFQETSKSLKIKKKKKDYCYQWIIYYLYMV